MLSLQREKGLQLAKQAETSTAVTGRRAKQKKEMLTPNTALLWAILPKGCKTLASETAIESCCGLVWSEIRFQKGFGLSLITSLKNGLRLDDDSFC